MVHPERFRKFLRGGHFAAGNRSQFGVIRLLYARRHAVGDAAGADDSPAQGFRGLRLDPAGNAGENATKCSGQRARSGGVQKSAALRVDRL